MQDPDAARRVDEAIQARSFYPPAPLRSTQASKEAQFELDPDELDTEDHEQRIPMLGGDEARDELVRDENDTGLADWGHFKGSSVSAGVANMSSTYRRRSMRDWRTLVRVAERAHLRTRLDPRRRHHRVRLVVVRDTLRTSESVKKRG